VLQGGILTEVIGGRKSGRAPSAFFPKKKVRWPFEKGGVDPSVPPEGAAAGTFTFTVRRMVERKRLEVAPRGGGDHRSRDLITVEDLHAAAVDWLTVAGCLRSAFSRRLVFMFNNNNMLLLRNFPPRAHGRAQRGGHSADT